MREGRPSATAQRVAMRRATHQLLDRPLIFDDPLAMTILGRGDAARLTEEAAQSESRFSRYLRAFLVARSQFAEDELALAVESGTRQYVVLGAGLDTFAYRNPHANLRVFEVDHPATQEWKLHRLEQSGISIPPSLTFAPVDFERQALSDGLVQAGLDVRQPVFFSWLGVTPYLPREAVFKTLQIVASISPGNGIVFDYSVPRSSIGPLHRMAFDELARRVAAAGEPFQGFFEPQEVADELRGMGFLHLEDLDAETINERYFRLRADGFRMAGAAAHLISARKQD